MEGGNDDAFDADTRDDLVDHFATHGKVVKRKADGSAMVRSVVMHEDIRRRAYLKFFAHADEMELHREFLTHPANREFVPELLHVDPRNRMIVTAAIDERFVPLNRLKLGSASAQDKQLLYDALRRAFQSVHLRGTAYDLTLNDTNVAVRRRSNGQWQVKFFERGFLRNRDDLNEARFDAWESFRSSRFNPDRLIGRRRDF